MGPCKDLALCAATAKDVAASAKGSQKAVENQKRPRNQTPGGKSYCGAWVLPRPKAKKGAVKQRQAQESAKRSQRLHQNSIRRMAAQLRAAAEKASSPRTPPRKISAKATTSPSKSSPRRASPSPSRSSPQRCADETDMDVDADPTLELVQEIQDWKQAVAWEKFGVPGQVFQGLIARGENCPLQHMLEEVNDCQVKCTCAMCIDCAGGNYPDDTEILEGLPEEPFVKVEDDRCKLFAYLAAKAAEFELPPLTKLPTAPSSMTLVTRLSREVDPSATEPWLRQVWRLPYEKQVDFFRLVHSICAEVMPDETGPFGHWFRFYGKSMLPVGAAATAGGA